MLNVPPWELADVPAIWISWAIEFDNINNEVERKQSERAASRAKAGIKK